VERTAWTDARLDASFDRVDRDLRDLRHELVTFRAEMNLRFDALHSTLIKGGGAMIVALLGAIVAFSLGGS
jgi:hypothetical protein